VTMVVKINVTLGRHRKSVRSCSAKMVRSADNMVGSLKRLTALPTDYFSMNWPICEYELNFSARQDQPS
jgi:hypothetical protein